MKKPSLIAIFAVMLTFVAGLSAPALADPGVEVVPTEHYFGDVELGSSSTTIITIENNEPAFYLVDYVIFGAGSNPDFSITSAPPPGTEIAYGDSVDVEVTYTPSALGYASATLQIAWTNGDSGVEHVSLEGVGVQDEPPPPVSVADILAFFDSSYADGTLYGNGPGNSANGRRNALRNMIEAAGDLIDDGYIEEACQQLLDAYRRCDGLPRPPEFVAGPAASELAGMILDLMAGLECTI